MAILALWSSNLTSTPCVASEGGSGIDLAKERNPAPGNPDQEQADVKDFGAKGDSTTDDTAAIQHAVDWAITHQHRRVVFPAGTYRITGTILIREGVILAGISSQGSTVQYGTTLIHSGNGHLLDFDCTSGTDYAGTGGGVRDMLIVKETGFAGGDAIRIYAFNDHRRPGEMDLSNVLIYARGAGQWEHALNIDGGNCTTPGAKGVRSIRLSKVRAAGCSADNEYIRLHQVTHIFSDYLQVDTGNGTGKAGISITGDSENLVLNMVCDGTLRIADNAANVVINARVSLVDIIGTNVTGVAAIATSGTQISNRSSHFRITSNVSAELCARVTKPSTNVTGDGSNYALAWDTVDTCSGLLVTSPFSEFTVTDAGTYLVQAQILYIGVEPGHSRSDSYIGHFAGDGTVKRTYPSPSNPAATSFSNGQSLVHLSGLLHCEFGDRIRIIANISGGNKTAGIYGSANDSAYTTLQVKKIP